MSHTDPEEKAGQEQRVVKLLLPVSVIRAMDRLLVNGVGGFTTRNEFVREAIDSYLLELTHPAAPAEPATVAPRGRGTLSVAPSLLDPTQPELFDGAQPAVVTAPITLTPDATALAPMPAEATVIAGSAQVIDEPLFGMHNRDYPSLWAARQLVDFLANGVVGFEEFADRATEEAWAFAEAIKPLEIEVGQKLTALFPTNPQKRQTASSAFRTFAIGNVTAIGREVHAEGPLFLWRIIDVARADGGLHVGLTEEGAAVLGRLAGLTVVQPHSPEHALIFIEHLRNQARADWWGFEQVLGVIAERPTRLELIDAFRAARLDWRESVAATNAQGYVARGREWGLIAPKVMDGRYELTEFGAELLAEGAAE